MIGLQDRQVTARNVEEAHQAGAPLRLAYETSGIEFAHLAALEDSGRTKRATSAPQAARPEPAYAPRHTEEEREAVLAVANEPRFANTPPAPIVPALADEGVYLARVQPFVACCPRKVRTLIADELRRPKRVVCPDHADCHCRVRHV